MPQTDGMERLDEQRKTIIFLLFLAQIKGLKKKRKLNGRCSGRCHQTIPAWLLVTNPAAENQAKGNTWVLPTTCPQS
jgi:hypothetical protein